MLRRDAWESFQTGHEPIGVSTQLLTSWRRSQWSGVDPIRTDVPVVDVDTDSPFVRAAAPILEQATELLGDTTLCLALADDRGTLAWRWASDESFTRLLDTIRMSTGTSFDEERVGTNGIGTALESRTVASVIGADHYVEAFQRWACVAAPVFHPVTGSTCGAVNITCWARDANPFLQLMAKELAADVTRHLADLASAEERTLLEAFVRGRGRTTAPVLAINAQMMITDEVCGSWGLDHDAIWSAVSELGARPIDFALRDDLRAQLWPVDADSPDAGAVLALQRDPAGAEAAVAHGVDGDSGLGPLERAEADVIARVLAGCRGNKSAAAAQLRISRATLYHKLRRYRLAWIPDPPAAENR